MRYVQPRWTAKAVLHGTTVDLPTPFALYTLQFPDTEIGVEVYEHLQLCEVRSGQKDLLVSQLHGNDCKLLYRIWFGFRTLHTSEMDHTHARVGTSSIGKYVETSNKWRPMEPGDQFIRLE